MNLGTYKSSIWARLENNTTFYTAAELVDAVNEVVDIANLFTGHYQGKADISGDSVANQVIYALPSNVLFPLAVWFDGRELNKTSVEALAGRSRFWMRETTETTGLPVSEWAPFGLGKIILAPADAVGGNTITVFGVLEPALAAADGDAVPLGVGFEDIAIEYGAHLMPFKEGGKPFADSAKVLPQFQGKLREQTRWRQVSFPRFFIEREQH